MSAVSDTWERGSPYERYIGRWSRRVAPAFVAWLALPPGRRWLDVGCGTGALSAAIAEGAAPSSLTGVEPSEGFLKTASLHLGDRATLLPGHAAALPLPDASVDAVVSGLVLNFVPDLPAAMAEMRRVLAPGGTLAAYVWDYGDGMQLIRRFWDAAVALDAAAAPLDEATRFPICRPEALAQLFDEARLTPAQTTAIEVTTRFDDFDDLWQPFLGGQGPAPAYAMSLDEARRTRLRDAVRERMRFEPDGSIALSARAWAVRAAKPARELPRR